MVRVLDLDDPPRTAAGRVDLDAVVDAVADLHGSTPWLLESVPGSPAATGWSAVVLGTAGRLTVPAVGPDGTPDPFARLDEVCDRLGLDPAVARDDALPACDGGLVGALAYDTARAVERLPTAAVADRVVPALDLVVADVVLHVDHTDETARVVHRPLPHERPPTEVDDLVAGLLARIAAGDATAGEETRPAAGRGEVATTLPAADYRGAVAAALERIGAGDTFQVNLAQRLTGGWDGDLLGLYRALRHQSPAPYGAVLPTRGAGIAAISPETFLDVAAGMATVRPVKGTRPRADDRAADLAAAEDLRTSDKDRAENVMVVDMERNDLGRVCVPGTVRVPRLLEVERHPTVWHLVSEVTGALRPGTTWGDLLRATFPCGSVTGAPKVSSMGIIDHLEPVRRNWYCGAFGWLGAGAGSTAVAIRTASLWPDGTVDYGAGGGVVADSDPAAEHAESMDKAAAFLAALRAPHRGPATTSPRGGPATLRG